LPGSTVHLEGKSKVNSFVEEEEMSHFFCSKKWDNYAVSRNIYFACFTSPAYPYSRVVKRFQVFHSNSFMHS